MQESGPIVIESLPHGASLQIGPAPAHPDLDIPMDAIDMGPYFHGGWWGFLCGIGFTLAVTWLVTTITWATSV